METKKITKARKDIAEILETMSDTKWATATKIAKLSGFSMFSVAHRMKQAEEFGQVDARPVNTRNYTKEYKKRESIATVSMAHKKTPWYRVFSSMNKNLKSA